MSEHEHGTPDISPTQAVALYAFVRNLITDDLVQDAKDSLPRNREIQYPLMVFAQEIVDMAALLAEMSQGDDSETSTPATDVAVLREARRIVEKYLHLSHVRIYQTMDELDNALDLITQHTENKSE
jgi:hypothetical protein